MLYQRLSKMFGPSSTSGFKYREFFAFLIADINFHKRSQEFNSGPINWVQFACILYSTSSDSTTCYHQLIILLLTYLKVQNAHSKKKLGKSKTLHTAQCSISSVTAVNNPMLCCARSFLTVINHTLWALWQRPQARSRSLSVGLEVITPSNAILVMSMRGLEVLHSRRQTVDIKSLVFSQPRVAASVSCRQWASAQQG